MIFRDKNTIQKSSRQFSSTIGPAEQGFTLIELLVVISIIGVLSSVVLTSLNSARSKARDSKRVQDKRQMILALNLYYDTNLAWPPPATGGACVGPATENCWSGSFNGSAAFVAALTPYISSFPNNGAQSGNVGYNRMVYIADAASGWLSAGPPASPAGAYLIWMQENPIPATLCPSSYTGHWDTYYYCYEHLGAP
jgi:prepilin-type N-terminal cleavage/methylation domain-containing protein